MHELFDLIYFCSYRDTQFKENGKSNIDYINIQKNMNMNSSYSNKSKIKKKTIKQKHTTISIDNNNGFELLSQDIYI